MKTDLTKQRDSLVRIWYEICSKLTLQEDILIHKMSNGSREKPICKNELIDFGGH